MARKSHGDLLLEELKKLKKQPQEPEKFQAEPTTQAQQIQLEIGAEPQVLFSRYRYPISSYTFTLASPEGSKTLSVKFGPNDFVSANLAILEGWRKTEESWAVFKGCGVRKAYATIRGTDEAGREIQVSPVWVNEMVVEDPLDLAAIVMEELTNQASMDWELISRQVKAPSGEWTPTGELTPEQYQQLAREVGAMKAEISIRKALELGLITQDYLSSFGEWPREKGVKPTPAVFASRYVFPQDHALALAQSIIQTTMLNELSNWSYRGMPGGAGAKFQEILTGVNPAAVNEINAAVLGEAHKNLCAAMDAALSAASQKWVDLFNKLVKEIQAWASVGMEKAPTGELIPPGARMTPSETGWWTAGPAGAVPIEEGGKPIPPNALADVIPQYATTFTKALSLIQRHEQAWKRLQAEYARICKDRAEEGRPCPSETFSWDAMTWIEPGSPEAEALRFLWDDLLSATTVNSILASIDTIQGLGIWQYITRTAELQWLEDLINNVKTKLEDIRNNNTMNVYAGVSPEEQAIQNSFAYAIDTAQRLDPALQGLV